MTGQKKRKGPRVTPKGTPDPNARPKGPLADNPRPRILGVHHGTPATLDEWEAEYGVRPKALPGSGFCMSCGKELVAPPRGQDRDHAVCHACFPEDLREEWEGRKVDFVRYDLDAGTIEEVVPPQDPFMAEGDNGDDAPDKGHEPVVIDGDE